MINILSCDLENVLYFKKATARFDQNALTFVRGANLDSSKVNPTGNGVGKTLLFSTISNVAYFSPPTAARKKSKKDLLGKNSMIAITSQGVNGHYYRTEQYYNKYRIFENAREPIFDKEHDLKISRIPLAEKFIRQNIFPQSQLEFFTISYLTSQRPFLFHIDSDINRMEHFSQMFRLEAYDELKKYFLVRLKAVKDDEIRLSVLENKALSLKAKLDESSKKVDKEKIAELIKLRKSLDKDIQGYIKRESELLANLSNLRNLKRIEEKLDELRSQYKLKKHPKDAIVYLKEQRSLVKAYDEYKSALESYTKQTKRLKSELDAIELPKQSKDKLERELKRKSKLLNGLEEELNSLKSTKQKYESLVERASEIRSSMKSKFGVDPKLEKVDLSIDYQSEIETYRTSLKLEPLLEHKHEGKGRCPTCLSKVDFDNIRKAVKTAKAGLKKALKKKQCQEFYSDYLEVVKKIKDLDYSEETFNELNSKVKRHKSSIEKLEASIATWKQYNKLKEDLDFIEKPKEPTERPDSDLTYEQINSIIDLCTDILRHLEAKARLLESSGLQEFKTVKGIKDLIKQEKDKVKKLENRKLKAERQLADYSEELDKYTRFVSEAELYASELESTQKEIDKIRPSLTHKKVLEVLVKAYSTKGLKTHAANKICSVLEQNLNIYRNLLFPEPFNFSVSATDRGLHVLVDRGKGRISDVRNLSGAESNSFVLLFLLSLLPLVPNERRTNILVLDEPVPHQDEVSRRLFLDSYLPALMEVVPNVFVITPHRTDYREGAAEWLITKHKGKSTLVTI